MGILLRWASVRRPARVADSIAAFDSVLLGHFLEVAQFAGGAPAFQLARASYYGDCVGVEAAVFVLSQPVNDDEHYFLGSDITDNAAHARVPRGVLILED